MNEADYIRIDQPYTGFDEEGRVCHVYVYRKKDNPAEAFYKTEGGERAEKVGDHEFRLESGRLIDIR